MRRDRRGNGRIWGVSLKLKVESEIESKDVLPEVLRLGCFLVRSQILHEFSERVAP